MKQYIGTKLIEAEKAYRVDGKVVTLAENKVPCGSKIERGYKVRYADGYESFSPQGVFESAYLPLEVNGKLKTAAPSISAEMVERFIDHHETVTMGGKTTVVRAVLKNGFVIVESSSCVSAENYDEKLGEEICMKRIRNKVWELLGFLLQTAVGGMSGEAAAEDRCCNETAADVPKLPKVRLFISQPMRGKSDEEIDAVFTVADALRDLRERNKNTKIFNSGLGISIFRDNSTRTRFSFASACNLLGLEEQVLDEKKSQIAHGETVRETANMVSFMADVIGIRDDMFIGEGHKYQKTFMDALEEGYRDGILEQRPTLVNLQCDVDHPTQCMADMLHIIHYFGGVENLKGKKVAMTWAYSPSYGKPLSVPQGVIGLFTRFGMDVTLAHPEGYEVMPEVEEIAKKNAAATGGSFKKCNDMKEAFKDADIVYPKSWAPFKAMEERTKLYQAGDKDGIDELEKKLLAQNAEHKDWACTEEMMKLTKDGKALYLHCLPADITGLSCPEGEVDNSVFDRYIVPLYKQASYKPYIIAAMMFLAQVKDPVRALMEMDKSGEERKMF